MNDTPGKYGFIALSDPKKDIIDAKSFAGFLEATKYFATVKNLPEDEFLKIYMVVKLK